MWRIIKRRELTFRPKKPYYMYNGLSWLSKPVFNNTISFGLLTRQAEPRPLRPSPTPIHMGLNYSAVWFQSDKTWSELTHGILINGR